jgi:ribosomal-protein-alanine N-acetyltransferase
MIKTVFPDQKNIISQIMKLEAEAFSEAGLNEWNLVPLIRHGRVFYIEENDLVIGCAQYMLDWNDHSRAYLVGISIAGNLQGKGYGTELLHTSIDILSEEGIKTVELTVDPKNDAAIAVYRRKLGFEITEQRSDEYGKGIHRIVMEKKIFSGVKG